MIIKMNKLQVSKLRGFPEVSTDVRQIVRVT